MKITAMKEKMKPESLMMTYGYRPELSEGSVKCPIFQTSTFVFNSAEEGKAFFEIATGKREMQEGEHPGLIYSRLNNPNLEILENRLSLWDNGDDSAVFESGMSAISTVLLEFLKPGDLLLFSSPTYGGTDHFIHHFLKDIGVEAIGFQAEDEKEALIDQINKNGGADRLKFIFIESPANPTNDLFDIEMLKEVADHFSSDDKKVFVGVDNTYMGPLWSHPLQHGADLVMYSATKYIGGHSDLIAGAVVGNNEVIGRIKKLRTYLGNMVGPHTAWLMLRSLETLKVRMEQQAKNAEHIATFLENHPKVDRVHFLGNLKEGSRQKEIFDKQYSSAGAMISIEVKGGEKESFQFLNHLQLIKLAVSLGSTESLAQHPATMTHAGVDDENKKALGITDNLVRISIGIENHEDLISDISNALDKVDTVDFDENSRYSTSA